jgi:hypothetical protein
VLERGTYTLLARCYYDLNDRENACKYIKLALESDNSNEQAAILSRMIDGKLSK